MRSYKIRATRPISRGNSSNTGRYAAGSRSRHSRVKESLRGGEGFLQEAKFWGEDAEMCTYVTLLTGFSFWQEIVYHFMHVFQNASDTIYSIQRKFVSESHSATILQICFITKSDLFLFFYE